MSGSEQKLLPILENIEGMKELVPENKNKSIYFLTNNGYLQYIGQSINMRTRIEGHKSRGEIEFDKVNYISGIELEDIDALEMTLIVALKPPMNKFTNQAIAGTAHITKYGLDQLLDWNPDPLGDKHREMLLGEE